jgi:hypothetical protein
MIVMERNPELDIRSVQEADLVVDPTDISFQDLDAESVTIRVNVRNEGERRSKLTLMRLESAPLGAFVPWQPLAVLSVPPIEPGATRELSINVKRSHLTPLGNFDRIPPSKVIAAVSSPDEPSQPQSALEVWLNLLRQRDTGRSAATNFAATTGCLAPDLWELLGRGQPHWAGNINVFIGARAVERHLAQALRVYPGRPNLAMFMVGGLGKRDAYAFDLAGLPPDWEAALYDVTNARTLVVGSSDAPIPERQWVETTGGLMIMMATHPPADCQEGNLEVHVTRQSCQKTAVVEFNLDPSAQGAGCYIA